MIYGITLILLALLATQEVAPGRDKLPICDDAFVALFTPGTTSSGRYEACVSESSITTGVQGIAGPDLHLAEAERLEALDAFGTSGSYSRARLTQLYGGRRVYVRRGWRETPTAFESVTLLSPYPDPTLTRLYEGTLIIRWITVRP